MKRLGDIATFVNGYPFKPEDWSDTGIPIIRIQDLTGNFYQTNKYKGQCAQKYQVKKGDVLISWSASLGVYIWNGENAVLNQHIFKVVFDKVDVDKIFFVHQVESILRKAGTVTHGATMKHLTKPAFNALPFYLPPISEQRRIASILDKVTDLITKRRAQLEKLDLLVKSRFVEMFGDPANTSRWSIKKLSELGELNRGVSKHRPRNDPKLLGGPYPLIQTGDVSNSGLYLWGYSSTYSDLGLAQSRLWKAGTLCITIAANIAQTAILTFDSCFPDSVVGFVPNTQTNVVFIHYWFSFFQKILEEQAPQVAQKNINLKILSELNVIVPPIELQKQFASFVQQTETTKSTIQKSLETLETLKKALMQEYFG